MIDPKARKLVTDLATLLATYACAEAIVRDTTKRQFNMRMSMYVFKDAMANTMDLDIRQNQAKCDHAERAFRRKLIQLRKLLDGND